jgi:hypothetical protein
MISSLFLISAGYQLAPTDIGTSLVICGYLSPKRFGASLVPNICWLNDYRLHAEGGKDNTTEFGRGHSRRADSSSRELREFVRKRLAVEAGSGLTGGRSEHPRRSEKLLVCSHLD